MNKLYVKCFLIILFFFGIGFSAKEIQRPSRNIDIFFKDTQNELEVIRIYGKEDGKTVFILGGIQGDEPGGYLSAESYRNISLRKGNLIVIPRANFHSIILNKRSINADMNRCFNSPHVKNMVEDSLVKIISSYMEFSDLFLNLHDGYGFFDKVWKDKNRNPSRYGQSLIADIDVFISENDTLFLKKMAEKVLDGANIYVDNPDYKLKFLNTNTYSKTTKYAEMRYSGSYYALNTHHIPSFGVESSKNLPSLNDKIYFHNIIINEFLKLFDVIPEIVPYNYEKPIFNFAHIKINDDIEKIFHNGDVILLKRSDSVRVTHINANYRRGLSCDILGSGNEQDFDKTLTLRHPTKLIFRKDSRIMGEIILEIDDKIHPEQIKYVMSINGEKMEYSHLDSIIVIRGDKIAILDVISNEFLKKEILVNLKGFAPPVAYNKGEDRNYLIDTETLRWKKYSIYKKGKVYPIVVTLNDTEISRAYISIK